MGKALDHQDSSMSILSYKNEDINSYPDLPQRTTRLALAAAGAISSHPLIDHTLPFKEHKFVMKITDFSKRHGHKLVVKSTKAAIDMGLSQPTKWCLLLYPNGNQEDRDGFVSLYLYRWDKQPVPVPATFTFAILNSYQEKSFVVDVSEKKMFGHSTGNSRSLGAPKFVSREDLLDPSWGLLQDDTLTVICELNVFVSSKTEMSPVPSSVQFRNWVEELHFLPHPDEAADKKKARPSGVSASMGIGMFNPMRFLHSIEHWKKVETEV